jgi:hypothetical protein
MVLIHSYSSRIVFGQTAKPDKKTEEEMKRYQQQLDEFLNGKDSKPDNEPGHCCSSSPKKKPKEGSCCSPSPSLSKPAVASPISPFQAWMKSKNPMKNIVGNVMDWFYWFFKSIIQDIKLLFHSGERT